MNSKEEMAIEIFEQQKRCLLYIQTTLKAMEVSDIHDVQVSALYMIQTFYKLDRLVCRFKDLYSIDLDSGIKNKFYDTVDRLEATYYGKIQA